MTREKCTEESLRYGKGDKTKNRKHLNDIFGKKSPRKIFVPIKDLNNFCFAFAFLNCVCMLFVYVCGC